MERATLVPAKPWHIGSIATRMREADRIECEALGRNPKQALRHSLRVSVEAWTAIGEDDRPVAMFGIANIGLFGGRASPWFLGTERVFDCAISLLELGPGIIASWLQVYDTLENIVSIDNLKAQALLRRWGAAISSDPSDRISHRGVEFVPFRFSRP
jgi:hypothetical protein